MLQMDVLLTIIALSIAPLFGLKLTRYPIEGQFCSNDLAECGDEVRRHI